MLQSSNLSWPTKIKNLSSERLGYFLLFYFMYLKIPLNKLSKSIAKLWVKNYKFLQEKFKNRGNKKQNYLDFLCENGFVLSKKRNEIFCVKLEW